MKRYILYTIVITTIFFVLMFLLRECTDSMIELSDSNVETTTLSNKVKYELDKSVKEYNLKTYEDWSEYIEYLISKMDYKFSQFIEKNETKYYYYKHSEDNQERNGETFINLYMHTAYLRILKNVFNQNGIWNDYPLTDNFKEKFNEKDGVGKYYNIPEENKEKNFVNKININTTMKQIDIDVYEIKDIYNDIYGKYDIYHLSYTLDENGYVDDIKLDSIESINDEAGNYVLKTDKYLMTDDNAKYIIYNICLYDNYLLKYGNTLTEWEDWKTEIDETGMTNDFRNFFIKNDGILPNKNFRSIEITKINVEENYALVRVELENQFVYYDIKWITDEKQRLKSVDVNINNEIN